MIEEKKRKLERKKATKMKEMKKQGTINLNALRREVKTHQFYLTRQPTWNPSLITGHEPFSKKEKQQVNLPMGVKK